MSNLLIPSLSAYGLQFRFTNRPPDNAGFCMVTPVPGQQPVGDESLVALARAQFTYDTARGCWMRPAPGLTPQMLRDAGFPELGFENLDREQAVQPWPQAETAPAPKEAKTRIEDFGAKIGGARKDLAAGTRITVQVIGGWTDDERAKFYTRERLWPEPDYKALVDAGAEPDAVYAIKLVRDGLPASPKSISRRRWFYGDRVELYGKTVVELREAFENVRTWDEFTRVVAEMVELHDDPRYQGGKRYSMDGASLGGRWGNIVANAPRRKDSYRLLRDVFSLAVNARSDDAAWRYTRNEIAGRREADTQWLAVEEAAPRRAALKREHAMPKVARERIGPDRRGGRDITTDELMETFGFRGGEFGNWEDQRRRQAIVNEAHDAFHDLADLLAIPPKAVSLNGSLAIAFGARGSGNARAHYEPGRSVINLTKTSGAGALAHEWFHAFDHYCFTHRAPGTDVLKGYRSNVDSVRPWKAPHDQGPGVRYELVQAWENVMKSILTQPVDREKAAAHFDGRAQSYAAAAYSWFVNPSHRIGSAVRASELVRLDGAIRRMDEAVQADDRTAFDVVAKTLPKPLLRALADSLASNPGMSTPDLIRANALAMSDAADKARDSNKDVVRARAIADELRAMIVDANDEESREERFRLGNEHLHELVNFLAFNANASIDKDVKKMIRPGGNAWRQWEEAEGYRVAARRVREGFDSPDGIAGTVRAAASGLAKRVRERAKLPAGLELQESAAELRASAFHKNAIELDAKRALSDPYYSAPWELAARAFEAYVADRLAAREWTAPYLIDGDRHGNKAYPQDTDRQRIDTAFDHLFGVLQSKVTEQGVALYSRAPDEVRDEGMSLPQAVRAALGIADRWRMPLRIGVVVDASDLPPGAPARARARLDLTGRRIDLVASNLRDAQDAEDAIAHEYFGHVGLRAVLGGDHEQIMTSIWADNRLVRERTDAVLLRAARNGEHMRRSLATEEALCDLAAEGRAKGLRGWDRVVSAVRSWLRDIGLGSVAGRWTDNDVQHLLDRARRAAPAAARGIAAQSVTNARENECDQAEGAAPTRAPVLALRMG